MALSDAEKDKLLDEILYSYGEGGFSSLSSLLAVVRKHDLPIKASYVQKFYEKQFLSGVFKKYQRSKASKESRWIVTNLGYVEGLYYVI